MAANTKEVCEELVQSEREGYQIVYIKEENLEDDYQDHGKTFEYPEEDQLQTYLIKEEDDSDDWIDEEDDLVNLETKTESSQLQDILEKNSKNMATTSQLPERRTSRGHETTETEWKKNQSSNKLNTGEIKTEVCKDVNSSESEGYQVIHVKEENLKEDWIEVEPAPMGLGQSSLQQDRCTSLETPNQSTTTAHISEGGKLQGHERHEAEWKKVQFSSKLYTGEITTEVCKDVKKSSESEGYQIIHVKEENLKEDWIEVEPAPMGLGQSILQEDRCTSLETPNQSTTTAHISVGETSQSHERHEAEWKVTVQDLEKKILSIPSTADSATIQSVSVQQKSFITNTDDQEKCEMSAGKKPYQCSICNQVFTSSKAVVIHMRTHTGEKPYQYSVCNKGFTKNSHLTKHKRTHTGEKPYQCSICNKGFTRNSHLTVHMRTHTGEKTYQCSFCNKGFTTSSDLTKHKRTHTGEKPYQCSVCNKGFTSSSNLTSHERTHTGEKPYQCTICNKGFTSSSNLTIHERTHTGEKPYQCTICNKGFTNNSSLTSHERTHTGEKPYQCIICNKGFTKHSNLTIHMRTHKGEKPYQCSICNKGFTRNSDLTIHMRIHTGEKPYRCCICNKSFTSSSGLTIHERSHTGEKPYQCSICNLGFVSSSCLAKHKRTHTGEKPYCF